LLPNMILKLSLLIVLFQLGTCSQQTLQEFVLDGSNPYVYLKLDHVGPRKPAVDGEPSVGVWIRLVNNCRLPILVPTISGDANGISVLDQVATYGEGLVVTATYPDGRTSSSPEPEHPKAPDGYDKLSG
jgi:hypothetical protein